MLVTGGAGYIGSHTVRVLINEGFNVVVYDNLAYGHREFAPKGVKFIEGDLADTKKLDIVFKENKFDAVVHFAAYAYVGESVKNPSKYFNNNVINGVKLLDAMIKNNVRKIVFSSSCAVYGVPKKMPINEDAKPEPINPYGLTKFIFEGMMEAYGEAYGLQFVSLRYFNAAGGMPDGSIGEWHEPETHVIPLILQGFSDNNFKVFGDDYPTKDGSCIRDYIHVIDLAQGHLDALKHLLDGKKSEKINLGTGKGTSVFELIKAAESVVGRKLNYAVSHKREGDPAELVADPKKAAKILGWKAKYGINEIVEHAYKWHRKKFGDNGEI